ncbi:phospholipase A and acyltransferase 1-like [Girardinichthys multiradiatus]|uniref:phospholipase A and acyltransferase 1-like n=1 Tax=Girardinichthys multiradiatus TaxID=208333 RepID=UPI001FAD2CE1|nr:phospholipase A and acyltransferase 1-like [Girardinichthys multiradiatus]
MCLCKTGTPLYKHYALYVDDEYPGKGNIIHRIKYPKGKDIGFGELEHEGKHEVENIPQLPPQKKEDIKKHIEAVLLKPGDYDCRSNNCEHLATYLRYGESFSKQPGTLLGFFCKTDNKNCDEWNQLVKQMEDNEKLEAECSICPAG